MYGTISQPLINSVKKYASDNHLTLGEIAKRSGIHPVSLSRIMTGKTKTVKVETLEKLKAIGVQVDLSSDEDRNLELVYEAQNSRVALTLGLLRPLMQICGETSEMESICTWVSKSPAGQTLFHEGFLKPEEIIARLLVYLHRKGLLAYEMPDLPGMRPPLSEWEIKAGMMVARLKEEHPEWSERQIVEAVTREMGQPPEKRP